MSLPVVNTDDADEDLLEQAEYFELREAGSGSRFLEASWVALSRLSDHPEIGAELDLPGRLSGVRRWSVPGFRSILILYRVEPTCVLVLRVVHGARDLPALFEE